MNTAVQALEKKGFKARAVSVTHLSDLREDLEGLVRQGQLHESIANFCLKFKYEVASLMPNAATVFVVAIHQPITRARFAFKGKVYDADIPPTYIATADEARVMETIVSVVAPAGFRVERARLPVKTLAARSGMAQYGKNNITYVPGFGSFARLVALASDCPCEQDSWGERRAMKSCNECFRCGETCPTGCIPTDRFLVHAENCLTWHNERAQPFPDWIKPDWHNALVGCLRCQQVCPANRNQLTNIVDGPHFSEAETDRLLRGPLSPDELTEETRRKVASIGMDDSCNVPLRNLDALIRNQDTLAR